MGTRGHASWLPVQCSLYISGIKMSAGQHGWVETDGVGTDENAREPQW